MLQKAHWSFVSASQLYINKEIQNYFTVAYATTFHLSLTVLFHYRSLTFYYQRVVPHLIFLDNFKNNLNCHTQISVIFFY